MRAQEPRAAGAGAGLRPIWWLGSAFLYFAAGFAVGFLLLIEFALRTLAIVQVAIVLLALIGLFGGLRRARNLPVWSLFVFQRNPVPFS